MSPLEIDGSSLFTLILSGMPLGERCEQKQNKVGSAHGSPGEPPAHTGTLDGMRYGVVAPPICGHECGEGPTLLPQLVSDLMNNHPDTTEHTADPAQRNSFKKLLAVRNLFPFTAMGTDQLSAQVRKILGRSAIWKDMSKPHVDGGS